MAVYRLHKYDEDGNLSLQFQFAQSRKPVQVFGGGYGNGKTTAAIVTKVLRVARDYPGSNILVARENYPKLNDTIRKVFFEWCPVDWIKRRPTQDDNTCYLTNGTVINFRYIMQRGKSREDGTTTSNLLSATYDLIVVDQIEDPGITEKDFDDLIGRLRGSATYRPVDGEDDPTMPSTGPGWMVVTANPSHGWFYKKIVLPFLKWRDHGIKSDALMVSKATGLPIMELFEGSTYTNKANLPPRYLELLESKYRGQQRERYLMGKWASFEGLVYPDFDMTRHLLTRRQVEEIIQDRRQRYIELTAIEGYDFGISSPSCYLFGFVDEWGRVVLCDGFYEREFPYTKQPARIREIRAKYTALGIKIDKPIRADPAIFKRMVVAGTNVAGKTLANIYRTEYKLRMVPGQNDILQGIAKTGAYLVGRDDVPHIVTGDQPGPMLYVCDELEFWTDEINSYFWKKNTQAETIDDPNDRNDHAMDGTKYLLSKQPEPSQVVIPKDLLPPSWMFWQEGATVN